MIPWNLFVGPLRALQLFQQRQKQSVNLFFQVKCHYDHLLPSLCWLANKKVYFFFLLKHKRNRTTYSQKFLHIFSRRNISENGKSSVDFDSQSKSYSHNNVFRNANFWNLRRRPDYVENGG